jgi:hypothetical protein
MIGSLLILAAIVRAYLGLDNHTIIEQHVVSICISGWFHIGHSLSMSHSKCIYVCNHDNFFIIIMVQNFYSDD